jgi:hypothetical protein
MWALPAMVHLDRLARRHHREHMEKLDRQLKTADPGP